MDRIEVVKFCKALANEKRLQILEALIAGQAACRCPVEELDPEGVHDGQLCCVDDLVQQLGMAQSTISQHLKELHTAGLLDRRKCAQKVYYTLGPKMREFAEYLQACCADVLHPDSRKRKKKR